MNNQATKGKKPRYPSNEAMRLILAESLDDLSSTLVREMYDILARAKGLSPYAKGPR